MPGHTGYYSDGDGTGDDANEEDLGGRPAFLFRSGEWAGVTLDSSGQNLPRQSDAWQLDRYFTLGVRDVPPVSVAPEAIIRGIRTNGYYIWRTTDPVRRAATTQ